MTGIFIDILNVNPYENLALEEYLLHYCERYQKPILYLWKNDKTVVIGKNQNYYTECNLDYIREKAIVIARRMTGGGAVYHDLGNVNYTIITPKDMYDPVRNTRIILNALNGLGIRACANGRNDICIDDRKISGNAYYSNDEVGLQHGTVLYQLDCKTMENALNVSSEKLTKRGIQSVRSRVSDIKSVNSDITIDKIKEAIVCAFKKEYELYNLKKNIVIDDLEYQKLVMKYSSKEWIEGNNKVYSYMKKKTFSWGEIGFSLELDGGDIIDINVESDCLDLYFVDMIKDELKTIISEQGYKINEFEQRALKCENKYAAWFADIDELFLEIAHDNGMIIDKNN